MIILVNVTDARILFNLLHLLMEFINANLVIEDLALFIIILLLYMKNADYQMFPCMIAKMHMKLTKMAIFLNHIIVKNVQLQY